MNNPESIVAWVRVWPDRHWAQLKAMVRLNPQFKGPAREAAAVLRAEAQPPSELIERP